MNIYSTASPKSIQDALDKSDSITFMTKQKFKIDRTLYIKSNTVLDLNGATLRRYTSGPLLRLRDGKDITKYNGTHHVTIKNGTLEGMSGAKYPYASNSLCTMFHCHDVIFENVTFLDIPGGHAVDCCGCKNVKFINCKFLGYASVGNDFRESIQIDFAYYGGLPTYKKGSPCYDMTRCKNITIDGCVFDKSNSFPSQYIAIGGHVIGDDDLWHENIIVRNCVAKGNGTKVGTDTAFISIVNFKNVELYNNKVSNYPRFVLVRKVSKIYDKDQEPSGDPKQQKNVSGLRIYNNEILTHKGTAIRWGIFCNVPYADNVFVNANSGMTKESCEIRGTNLNINI